MNAQYVNWDTACLCINDAKTSELLLSLINIITRHTKNSIKYLKGWAK